MVGVGLVSLAGGGGVEESVPGELGAAIYVEKGRLQDTTAKSVSGRRGSAK